MMRRWSRWGLAALLLSASACAAPLPPAPPPPAPPPPASPVAAPVSAEPAGPLRAVFHLSDPARPGNVRGLQNAANALQSLGETPARFVVVVHGPALGWFRRAEPDNLAEPLAKLLATGRVELRVCARTMEENHWRLEDILPGAVAVPSGTVEVIRLQREGFAYFKP